MAHEQVNWGVELLLTNAEPSNPQAAHNTMKSGYCPEIEPDSSKSVRRIITSTAIQTPITRPQPTKQDRRVNPAQSQLSPSNPRPKRHQQGLQNRGSQSRYSCSAGQAESPPD